ncbi:dimethylaniline monooxygenase [N-oxide-forming] 2-like [Ambystoma mexicanum]|uniref:dimethylaniline monooxygenase [N-oxide-forming] 2-like n=1 Tax=Ambystoma mexicanum TaxID=8296 RepID=UPI0037E85658
MENMVKRVAVIGAGCAGLAATKSCLEEGLEPTCFEKSNGIGGLWRYTEEVEEGRASIYRSLVTNTSKEMSCYSDFPMPAHFPNFMHNSKFLEYLKLYAEHFNLMKHIMLQTKVCSVRKTPDFTTTGQWDVVTERDGKQESAIFDAVLVCSGRYVKPIFPRESFNGLERFKGTLLHSREYKQPTAFQGKRVLVVGIGNSGVDIATDLSDLAAKVFISTRRGCWLLSRLGSQGFPWDACFTTRFKTWLRLSLPVALVNWLFVRKLNEWFDQEVYGLQRDNSLWKDPLANDYLPACIIRGSVVIKPTAVEFSETTVTFEDGTREDIDVIIFATGFSIDFPFLDESVIKSSDSKVFLYKNVFPPEMEEPTLAFIGLVQPIASILVVNEMQARWVPRVLKGLNKLPPLEKRMEDIEKKSKTIRQRYVLRYMAISSASFISRISFCFFMDDGNPRLAPASLVGKLQ